MYHALEIAVVTLVVGIAGMAVLNRYARPLIRPLRHALARALMRAPAGSVRHRLGTRFADDTPAAGCGSGCGDDSGCSSCGSSAADKPRPIKIVRHRS